MLVKSEDKKETKELNKIIFPSNFTDGIEKKSNQKDLIYCIGIPEENIKKIGDIYYALINIRDKEYNDPIMMVYSNEIYTPLNKENSEWMKGLINTKNEHLTPNQEYITGRYYNNTDQRLKTSFGLKSEGICSEYKKRFSWTKIFMCLLVGGLLGTIIFFFKADIIHNLRGGHKRRGF